MFFIFHELITLTLLNCAHGLEDRCLPYNLAILVNINMQGIIYIDDIKIMLQQVVIHLLLLLLISCFVYLVVRYTRVARAVIQHSRGESVSGGWLQDCGREASFDDISAFVIPLNETYQVSQLKFQGSQELKEAVENE